MPRILITGVCGMIGSHLAERLVREGHTVTGTFYKPTTNLSEMAKGTELVEMDLRYSSHVGDVVTRIKPDTIYHLGAQSYPTLSWERPQETLDTNVIGTANVFEAVKSLRYQNKSYDPVVVAACSSAEYGASLLLSNEPVSEDAQLLPLHPYGVSKVATDLLSYQYFKSDGIRTLRARIFNTSGPRKRGDVISDFARRVAALPQYGGTLIVGNLSTKRAFLHVNDTVEALVTLAVRGIAGEAYNISGTEVVSVGELIPMFQKASARSITTQIDQSLLRPTDEPIIWGSIAKIAKDTGWSPQHQVSDIVRDVFQYEAASQNSKIR
jgi:GDP-4-dehydro-6-deoxy-D-mannose reductase